MTDSEATAFLFEIKRLNGAGDARFETPSGNGKGSWFATAWFTWGLNIGQQLTFVKLEDYR